MSGSRGSQRGSGRTLVAGTSGEDYPTNLDGGWEEGPTDEHGYRHFRAGRVEVRGYDGHDGFEPDGELVTHGPVRVHMERMDGNHWWIGLSWGQTGHVAVDFHSKKPIEVMWRDERG
jgi:hypothetical protein